MSQNRILLVAGILALLASRPVVAESRGDNQLKTDELRKEYAAACGALDKIERPQIGAGGFPEKLAVWSKAFQRKRDAAQALLPPLVQLTSELPADAEEFPKVRAELLEIHQEMTGQANQASLDQLSFFADTIFPHLLERNLGVDRARLFVKLTTPDQLVRVNDRAATSGAPTESHNWNVQDAHALSLMRAGKLKAARKESDLLLKKVCVNLNKGNPLAVGGVNYRDGVRSDESLRREYLLHRALIEAVAGESEAAKAKLAESMAIEEDDAIKRSQTRVVQEIESRSEGDASKKDATELQGTWKVTALEAGGRQVPAESVKGNQFIFKGDKVSLTGHAKDLRTYRLDATAEPKGIDISGTDANEFSKGIYEIDGDTLKLCLSQSTKLDRPKDFDTTGTKYFCFTLKRTDAAKRE